MNLLKEKYIIIEIIPTAIHPDKGDIIQLSALKLDGIKLIDRFDERLEERLIALDDFKELISYDKESFKYRTSTKEILDSFKEWSDNLPLLILDNAYTNNFLKVLPNKKESILKYLNKEYTDHIIEDLVKEHKLEPSNYIVDLLYESLIKHL